MQRLIVGSISRVFQRLALCVVKRDWFRLHTALINEYDRLLRDVRHWPPLPAQQLLIAGEDHRFFSHPGFDMIAICRAIWRRITDGRIEGGSTISQQVVRVLTGRYERTLNRKFKELLLATLVTSVVPKEHQPALYLRIGYFGWRMNTFSDACRELHLQPHLMSVRQCAEVVARLKYPQPRCPSHERIQLIERRVAHLMQLRNTYGPGVSRRGQIERMTIGTIQGLHARQRAHGSLS